MLGSTCEAYVCLICRVPFRRSMTYPAADRRQTTRGINVAVLDKKIMLGLLSNDDNDDDNKYRNPVSSSAFLLRLPRLKDITRRTNKLSQIDIVGGVTNHTLDSMLRSLLLPCT